MSTNRDAADVVSYWHAIELFSPQSVPKRTSLRRSRPDPAVFDLEPRETAPWQPGHRLTSQPIRSDRAWRFTVFGGLYDTQALRDSLIELFGDDGAPADEHRATTTALFALTLDAEGNLVEDSATLSSCGWAVGRAAAAGGDRSLSGFDAEQQAFRDALNKLVPPNKSNRPPAEAPDDGATTGSKVAAAVTGRIKSAGVDAWSAGAEEAGATVRAATSAAVGPFGGTIAGAVAGQFVQSLVGPPDNSSTAEDDEAESAAAAHEARFTPDPASLHSFVQELAAHLGVADLLDPRGVRVRCETFPKRGFQAEEQPDFLNSHIVDDLRAVEDAIRDDRWGTGLRTFLGATGGDAPTRTDVRHDRAVLVSGVSPDRAPLGRWPGDVAKPLALSQQFAVNEITALPGSGGVFAVNGPPGTGKTTLLRDGLAAAVVERAGRLAEIRYPRAAFPQDLGMFRINDEFDVRVREPMAELTGFEVVLATGTNTAAENVTSEVPGVDAVRGAEDEALDIDYFTDIATRLRGAPAWGLIAAVLGNRSKRSTFVRRFWKNGAPANTDDDAGPQVGMKDVLKSAGQNPETVEDWPEAVERFRRAERDVRRLVEERAQVAASAARLHEQQQELPDIERTLSTARAEYEQLGHV